MAGLDWTLEHDESKPFVGPFVAGWLLVSASRGVSVLLGTLDFGSRGCGNWHLIVAVWMSCATFVLGSLSSVLKKKKMHPH